MREFAPAKVNLYLHVTGRRTDGYHLLDSLAVFPAIGDVVHAAPADDLTLSVSGPFAGGLQAEPDNLVLRAARTLAAHSGIPALARLTLEKHLPVASGIGGGSADAAAAMRLLARLWGVPNATPALAVGLGADVPVCLSCTPTRMGGIGEILTASPGLPTFGMVLANPRVGVATPAVFRARAPGFTPTAALPAAWPDAASMASGLAGLTNDLQDAAIALCPPIAEVLAALRVLPGCLLARMSGSGATCFALFATPEAAEASARRLERPDWWVWGGAGQCGSMPAAEMGLAETGRST
jgi:4-diphosphocytidyl-2-C-methyl-D-erythritol kinase